LSIKFAEEANFTFCAEPKCIADLELLGWFDKGAPVRPIQPLVQRGLDGRLRGPSPDPAAQEAGCNDPAVIDHQAVARAQQIWKIANAAIFELPLIARSHHQEPGRVAGGGRP